MKKICVLIFLTLTSFYSISQTRDPNAPCENLANQHLDQSSQGKPHGYSSVDDGLYMGVVFSKNGQYKLNYTGWKEYSYLGGSGSNQLVGFKEPVQNPFQYSGTWNRTRNGCADYYNGNNQDFGKFNDKDGVPDDNRVIDRDFKQPLTYTGSYTPANIPIDWIRETGVLNASNTFNSFGLFVKTSQTVQVCGVHPDGVNYYTGWLGHVSSEGSEKTFPSLGDINNNHSQSFYLDITTNGGATFDRYAVRVWWTGGIRPM